MNEENQRKFKIGLLKAENRRKLDSFEKAFLEELGPKELNYLNIENSFLLNGPKVGVDIVQISSGRMSRDNFLELLDSAKKHITDCSCWVFLSNYEYVGGIQYSLHDFLGNAIKLLSLDKDTVWARLEMDTGIMLDYDGSPLELDGGYELFVWGRWADECKNLLKR